MQIGPATGSSVNAELREFLARALPWPQEHDQYPSFANIHHVLRLTNDDGAPKLGRDGKQMIAVPGRACRTIEEAVRYIDWCNGLKTDIYVCMSAQKSADETVSKRNFKYFKAIRRTDNVLRHKSLYIDVDVKPEDPAHGYASPEEAVHEFVRIRDALSLPRQSYVVRSGSGGFHVHWCLAEPIAPERWRPLAAALSAGFLAQGFRGDTQCIVDSVRLLRPPGTFNYKRRDAPSPVTLWGNPGHDHLIEALEDPLKPYVGLLRAPASKSFYLNGGLEPRAKVFDGVVLPGLDAGLSAGLDVLHPTIEDVAAGCPFILRTLALGGLGNNNPLWLQTTNLSLFVQDSRATAHRLSSGYPTYTQAETDALFDRQQDTQRERDLGWPRCSTIASFGAPECTACPNRTHDRSPLNFARSDAQQAAGQGQGQGRVSQPGVALVAAAPINVSAAALAPLPSLYAYDQINRVCVIETDDTGKQTFVPLCSYTMQSPWLQQSPPSLNFTAVTTAGTETAVRLPYEVINDSTHFKRTLGKAGVLPFRGQYDKLGEFFVSWIETLRNDRKHVVQNQMFGWAVKGGKLEGFVYGGYLWSKAVPRPAASMDHVLSSQYSPTGELQPWLDAAKLITNQHRPALDAILASAFAAPLVRFTGHSGVLLSAFSTLSGIGKSTALKVGQATWGHPQKAIQSLSDTQNAVLKKIGDIRNLTLFWDELKTKEDTSRFANLAFQLSLGKEKSRLQADTSYRDPGTWQTMLCSTSNDSLLAFILSQTKTTAAGLYRIFEFEVDRGHEGQISPAEAALIISALNDNYGQAGLRYAQFLGQQHERIAAEVEAYSKQLEASYKIRADERFWLAAVVTIVMGAQYGNELGLTAINIDQLARFMVDQLHLMRNEESVSTVDIHDDVNLVSILSRYFNEFRQSHALITDHMWNGVGKPTHQMTLKGNIGPQLRSIRIHIAEEDQVVRFFKRPWDDWLAEKGLTSNLINKQLIERCGAKQYRAKLGAGTGLPTSAEACFELDCRHPTLQGLL